MNCKVLAMAILASGSSLAGSPGNDKLTVCLNPGDQGYAIQGAETIASKILIQAGVELRWRTARRDCASREIRPIVISLLEKVPRDAAPGSLARAFVFEGVHIEVFEPKVSGLNGIDPVVLGHVLAHEITHILQGTPRHSETGVMKACWNQADFEIMHYRLARLTPEDIDLIQRGMLRRRSAGCAGGCDLAGQPGAGELPVAHDTLGR